MGISYTDKTNRQAYELGTIAKKEGKQLSDNPYQARSNQWLAWQHGFKFGNMD